MNDKKPEINSQKKTGILSNKLLLLLVIFLSIVFVAAVVIGVSFIAPKNIKGAWELVVNPELPAATADEAFDSDKAYYVFYKPDKYGRGEYYTCYQGGVEYYKYELLKEDSVNKINLGAENMEYRITGSKLLGNAKLTIIFPEYDNESTGETFEAQEYVFEQAKNPDYEKQCYKEFNTDSALTGEKWTSRERTLAYYYYEIPYTQSVEFTDDGIMKIRYESQDLALDRYMYYAYTAKDKELVFSLVTDKDTRYTLSYDFDEKGNLKFTDDKTASSMFADAFFGEFTFYTQDNLPQPTTSADINPDLTE